MPNRILIYKCEECPYAQFDPQENPDHWGSGFAYSTHATLKRTGGLSPHSLSLWAHRLNGAHWTMTVTKEVIR